MNLWQVKSLNRIYLRNLNKDHTHISTLITMSSKQYSASVDKSLLYKIRHSTCEIFSPPSVQAAHSAVRLNVVPHSDYIRAVSEGFYEC